MDLTIPDFFDKLASKSRIKNVQMSDIEHLFEKDEMTGKPVVYIHNYLFCMVASLIKDGKTVRVCTPLRILSCKSEPFIGEHKVFLEGKEQIVDTLSSIKISHIKAIDQIAFDKCTFLLIPEHQIAIRLCVIRSESFVAIPITGKETEMRRIPPRHPVLSLNVLYSRIMEYYEEKKKEVGVEKTERRMLRFFNTCHDDFMKENRHEKEKWEMEAVEEDEEENGVEIRKRKWEELELRVQTIENYLCTQIQQQEVESIQTPQTVIHEKDYEKMITIEVDEEEIESWLNDS